MEVYANDLNILALFEHTHTRLLFNLITIIIRTMSMNREKKCDVKPHRNTNRGTHIIRIQLVVVLLFLAPGHTCAIGLFCFVNDWLQAVGIA